MRNLCWANCLLTLTLFIFACKESVDKRAQPLWEVWHNDHSYQLIFRKNGSFDAYYRAENLKDHRYGRYIILDDSTVRLQYTLPEKIVSDFVFERKDSILVLKVFKLIYHDTLYSEFSEEDYFYGHLNPQYSRFQIEQLYKYGEIIDTDRKAPFIYFEF